MLCVPGQMRAFEEGGVEVSGASFTFVRYLVPVKSKQVLRLHLHHKVKMVSSVVWTLPGCSFLPNLFVAFMDKISRRNCECLDQEPRGCIFVYCR